MTVLVIGDGTGQTAGVADAQLSQTNSASNNGTANASYVGTTASKADRQVIKFTGFPVGYFAVTDVVITIRNMDTATTSRGVEVRRLLTNFIETEATWNKRNASTNWNVAGAIGGTDVDATVIATGTIPSTSNTQFAMSGAGLTALVEGWMNGTIPNNGVIWSVVNDTTVFDNISRRVANKENATSGNRPYLTVTYTSITPPSLTVSDPTVSHLSGTATFTITASSTFGTNLTVDYATADVTATAGVDYVAKSGTATITAGQTTTTVVVDILP